MDIRSTSKLEFAICPARLKEYEAVRSLAHMALLQFQNALLNREQVDASYDLVGIDETLIEDGTYYIGYGMKGMVGCGGFSKRYIEPGKDFADTKNARLLDPKTEATRLRAIYTEFKYGRQGIGTVMLAYVEEQAKRAGFHQFDALATVTAEPMLAKAGYRVLERELIATKSGPKIPFARMTKSI